MLDGEQAEGVVGLLLLGQDELAGVVLLDDLLDAAVDAARVAPDGDARVRVEVGRARVRRPAPEPRRLGPRRLAPVRDLPRRLPPRQPRDVVQSPDQPVPLRVLPVLRSGGGERRLRLAVITRVFNQGLRVWGCVKWFGARWTDRGCEVFKGQWLVFIPLT